MSMLHDVSDLFDELCVDLVFDLASELGAPERPTAPPPLPLRADDALEFDLRTPSRWSELPHLAPPVSVVACAPSLVVHDAPAALAFYARAFGAMETYRETLSDGRIFSTTVAIGAVTIVVCDDIPELRCSRSTSPALLGGTPVTILLLVDGVEALFLRAVQSGARVIQPLQYVGSRGRQGVVEDPFGHRWSLSAAHA